jgi:hypothetical protein
MAAHNRNYELKKTIIIYLIYFYFSQQFKKVGTENQVFSFKSLFCHPICCRLLPSTPRVHGTSD